MSTDLQSAVERLTILRDNPTRPAVGLSVVDCADLRLVLDALAVAQAECLEQARLLGKSGSREADLLTKLAAAHRDCDRLSGMEQAAREELAEAGAKWEQWQGMADQLAEALSSVLRAKQGEWEFNERSGFEDAWKAELDPLRAYEQAKDAARAKEIP